MAGHRKPINQRAVLSRVLKSIRSELPSCAPVYFAKITGIDSDEDLKMLPTIMSGIASAGELYHIFGYSAESGALAFFGEGMGLAGTIECIHKLSPQIAEVGRCLFPDPEGEVKEVKPDRGYVFSALMTMELVKIIREKEPESLSLPVIASCRPFYEESPGQTPYFIFPGGSMVYSDYTLDGAIWGRLRDAVNRKSIAITILKTPILQSAAIAIRYLLDTNQGKRHQKPARRKQRLFHSGHKESEGEWSDPIPLSRIAQGIRQTEEATKKILAQTGLIQKTRQNWIARTDDIKEDWADAIIDARKVNRDGSE